MGVKDLVLKLTAQKKAEEVDWDKTRREWIAQVDKLLKTVDGWLKELLEEQYAGITVRREKMTLSEEQLGNCQTDKLVIEIADEWLVMEPVGRLIIGAQGRIDFFQDKFEGGKYLILRYENGPEQSDWQVANIKTKADRHPFDRDAFERILEEMLEEYGHGRT